MDGVVVAFGGRARAKARFASNRAPAVECPKIASPIAAPVATIASRSAPITSSSRGDAGFPVLDFRHAACTFCAECVRVCRPARSSATIPRRAVGRPRATSATPARATEGRVPGLRARHATPAPSVSARTAAFNPRSITPFSGCGACVAPVSRVRHRNAGRGCASPFSQAS